jgi:hypothetical protein
MCTGRWGHSLVVMGDTGWVFGGRDKVAHFGDFYKFSLTKNDSLSGSHEGQTSPTSSSSPISTPIHWQSIEMNSSSHSRPHVQVVLSNSSSSSNSSGLIFRVPDPRYFHAAVAYHDRLVLHIIQSFRPFLEAIFSFSLFAQYIIWGKNFFDFCFKDVSEFNQCTKRKKKRKEEKRKEIMFCFFWILLFILSLCCYVFSGRGNSSSLT